MRKYITPPQVAKQLGVHVDNVRTWIHSGELRAADFSKTSGRPRWRIALDDLESFVASRSTSPPPKSRRQQRHRNPDVIEFYK